MSLDDEQFAIDEAIVGALRDDASSRAPRAARERVFVRLAAGAATSAGVAQAAGVAAGNAASLIGASVTGAGLGAAAGTYSTLGLVKLLSLGFALGVGAYSAARLVQGQPVVRAAPSSQALGGPAAGSGSRGALRSEERPSLLPPAIQPAGERPPPVALQQESLPARSPPAPGVARSPESEAQHRGSHAGAESRGLEQAVDPSSERAGVATLESVPLVGGLAEQQALLDQARAALVRGEGGLALSAVESQRLRFPESALAEERAAIEVRALAALGRRDEARRKADHFAERFPRSLFLPSIRAAVLAPTTPGSTKPRRGE